MRFGVCVPVASAALARQQGWDFVEENIQTLFQGQLPDAQWQNLATIKQAPLPVLAANCLIPGSMKITGPSVDFAAVTQYITHVMARARQAGTKTLVFGSAGARNVPEGFDRQQARQQILDFLKMAVPLAARNSVTLVAEPLNKGESNIINTVAEAMTYVKAINQPAFQCLVDAFHFNLDGDSLEDLRAAMPWIKHVHLADREGRVAPGTSGKTDYRPIFKVLKEGKYDGALAVEAFPFDLASQGAAALAFIKKQWSEA